MAPKSCNLQLARKVTTATNDHRSRYAFTVSPAAFHRCFATLACSLTRETTKNKKQRQPMERTLVILVISCTVKYHQTSLLGVDRYRKMLLLKIHAKTLTQRSGVGFCVCRKDFLEMSSMQKASVLISLVQNMVTWTIF